MPASITIEAMVHHHGSLKSFNPARTATTAFVEPFAVGVYAVLDVGLIKRNTVFCG